MKTGTRADIFPVPSTQADARTRTHRSVPRLSRAAFGRNRRTGWPKVAFNSGFHRRDSTSIKWVLGARPPEPAKDPWTFSRQSLFLLETGRASHLWDGGGLRHENSPTSRAEPVATAGPHA